MFRLAPRAISLALLVGVTFFPSPLAADGCYVPEKAYRQLPSIPGQRALVTFREGVERLTVESSLDAEGQSFGWIIPVPARPQRFAEASGALLDALDLTFQPEVIHDRRGEFGFLVFGSTIAFFVMLILVHRASGGSFLIGFLLLMFTLILVGLRMLLISQSSKGSGGPEATAARVLVEEARIVGSYELAVLRAKCAADLGLWLDQNGFSKLPPEGDRVVEGYLGAGWHIVAVKLRRQINGASRPHPLLLEFPVSRPIFPLKLTRLSGRPVRLELFVVAEGEARTGRLGREFVDRLQRRTESVALSNSWFPRPPQDWTCPVLASARDRSLFVADPAALTQWWDGCVLTKLTGELQPDDMRDDVVLEITEPRPHRTTLYSPQGAWHTALVWALWTWCTAGLGLVAVRCRSIGSVSTGLRSQLQVLLFPAIASVFVGCGVRLVVQVIGVSVPDRRTRELLRAKEQLLDDLSSELRCLPEPKVENAWRLLTDLLTFSCVRNERTGRRLKLGFAPGDVALVVDERGLVLREVLVDGRRRRIKDREIVFRRPRRPQDGRLSLSVPLSWQGLSEADLRLVVEQMIPKGCRPIDERVLAKITGFSFESPGTRRPAGGWLEWWDGHKHQTRREWLVDALRQKDGVVAAKAGLELAELGDPAALSLLKESLAEPTCRTTALCGLIMLKAEEGHRALMNDFQSSSHETRGGAARIMLWSGQERYTEALFTFLEQDKLRNDLQDSGLVALLSLKDPKRVGRSLVRQLETLGGHPNRRVFITSALGGLSRIDPPLAPFDDAGAMARFLAAVHTWCDAAPVNGPAGRR